MRDDLQRQQRVLRDEFRDRIVSADVIRMQISVDDITKRTGRELADLRHDFWRQRGVPGIDHQHALAADLHRDVAASARKHVNVMLHRLRMDLNAVEIRRLRGSREGTRNQQPGA
jgi:hypothetical protein